MYIYVYCIYIYIYIMYILHIYFNVHSIMAAIMACGNMS